MISLLTAGSNGACSTKRRSQPKFTPKSNSTLSLLQIFFFFFSELVQVTHSNMASWAFRCPSPCWALSGPTEHSRQFQAFTCHFLPRPPLRSSYHEALYLYTIFIHELRVGKGREMEDSYFWSSLQLQYRPENITEARENEVAWLLKMRTRSISVCCKLIGKRLQVRDD